MKKLKTLLLGAALLAAASTFAADSDVAPSGTLTVGGARRVMAAALDYAQAHGAPGGAIAIVDPGGALILFERPDGTFPAGSRVAIGKASTAATFRKATKGFEEAVNGGRYTMTALPDFYPLQGGVPIVRDGVVVGAIGVSGAASAQQDEEIAQAGAAALAASRAEGGR